MQTVEKSIEVEAPLAQVYNQWTQFEQFPRFMEGVEQVKQLDDKRLHWVAEIGGRRKEWDAEIFEQVPDQKIAWRSTSGADNAGIVSFRRHGTESHAIVRRLRERGVIAAPRQGWVRMAPHFYISPADIDQVLAEL